MGKFDGISFYGHEDEELQKEYKRLFCNMTQEDKELLLKDLCARLPYKTICKQVIDGETVDCELSVGALGLLQYDTMEVKPYLRPMLSMTEEEAEQYNETCFYSHEIGDIPSLESFDWLNAHYFDYRGLIEMGLALEAKEGMYKME